MDEQDFTLDFGEALKELKEGNRLTRLDRSWGGRCIYLVNSVNIPVTTTIFNELAPHTEYIHHNEYIGCYHWDQTCSVWIPTMEDLLAEDWAVSN